MLVWLCESVMYGWSEYESWSRPDRKHDRAIADDIVKTWQAQLVEDELDIRAIFNAVQGLKSIAEWVAFHDSALGRRALALARRQLGKSSIEVVPRLEETQTSEPRMDKQPQQPQLKKDATAAQFIEILQDRLSQVPIPAHKNPAHATRWIKDYTRARESIAVALTRSVKGVNMQEILQQSLNAIGSMSDDTQNRVGPGYLACIERARQIINSGVYVR